MTQYVELARMVYRKLRKPSQQALPWETVQDALKDSVIRLRLDLTLSPHNTQAKISPWFTLTGNDRPLEDLGLNVLMPIRVETRAGDSEYETGRNVPIVNYDVLDTSIVGACAFYGDPLHIAFRDGSDYVGNQEFRIVYEEDFADSVDLTSIIGLPAFFDSYIVLLTAYALLEVVDDQSPEWMEFLKIMQGRWESQIALDATRWNRFVDMFKGKAQVPKRTFFQNQQGVARTKYFRD